MSAEIHHLEGRLWNAHAALAAALNELPIDAQVMIIYYDAEGSLLSYSSGLDHANALYMTEKHKMKILEGVS